jgi:transposase
MTAITTQQNGNYKYIYLSDSKWDPILKYNVNEKIRIGKIDLKTGNPVFLPTFLEDMQESHDLKEKVQTRFPGVDLSLVDNNIKIKPIGRYPGDQIKFGITYFLYNIAASIGLLAPLKESFSDDWKKIFTIASFLIFENRAIMECDDFVEENITFPVGSLSSQRTSELLLKIDYKEYNKFFNKWSNYIKEKECIAFDATSIPSYSQNNDLVAYGKAKSNPEMKQLNLCLLYGEKSKLPIYQTVYNGSLNDVSTILSVLKEFEAIAHYSDILIVNDKGFYSKKNISELFSKTDVKFLSAVPLNNTDAIQIVDHISSSKILDLSSSVIYTNHDSIRGTTLQVPWYDSCKFYTHVFFDCMKNLTADTHFKEDLKQLRDLYLNDKLPAKDLNVFNKFFIVDNSKSKKSKYHLLDNTEEIEKFLKYEGYLVLISNQIKDPQEAHYLYVNKDCVEKAFRAYKQNLGMHRIFTGSSKRFTNKAVVAFIALILNSHIYRVMSENKLFRNYTCSQMLRQITQLQAFLDIDDKYYLKPITKKQKEIFEAFQIDIPNRYSINYFIKNILK